MFTPAQGAFTVEPGVATSAPRSFSKQDLHLSCRPQGWTA